MSKEKNKNDIKQEIELAAIDISYIMSVDKIISDSKDKIIELELILKKEYVMLEQHLKRKEKILDELFARYNLSKEHTYNIDLINKKITLIEENK